MKTVLTQRPLPRMAGIAAALIAAATTLSAQLSPVGSWDFVLRGGQKGVAQIVFNPDFTIDGTEVITIRPSSRPDSDPRSGIRGGIRVGDSSTNGMTNVFFYGTSSLSGVWTYDSSGIIVGVLTEGEADLINGVSFRGKRSGQRVNLVGHSGNRTIHYRGVPLTTLADISGNFYATGNKNGQPYVEIFNLAPDGVTANRYMVTGQGPAYDFVGFALLSGQKNLAIASLQNIGTNGVLSALSGGYSINKGRGSLTGVDEVHSRVTSKVRRQ